MTDDGATIDERGTQRQSKHSSTLFDAVVADVDELNVADEADVADVGAGGGDATNASLIEHVAKSTAIERCCTVTNSKLCFGL